MNKALSKAIMQRTKLRNKSPKDPSAENKLSDKKQRNWCVSLLPKEKKKYLANLNQKNTKYTKNFCKTTKPILSEETKSREKITKIEIFTKIFTKSWFHMMQKQQIASTIYF